MGLPGVTRSHLCLHRSCHTPSPSHLFSSSAPAPFSSRGGQSWSRLLGLLRVSRPLLRATGSGRAAHAGRTSKSIISRCFHVHSLTWGFGQSSSAFSWCLAVDLGLKMQVFEWALEITLRKKENKSSHRSIAEVGFHSPFFTDCTCLFPLRENSAIAMLK